MASAFGHAFTAYAISNSIAKRNEVLTVYITSIILSVLPDLDVISFSFGIPYSSAYGHRGFTHSIVFSIIIATIIVLIFKLIKKKPFNYNLLIVFFLSSISHSILDMFTNGGLGVALLWPFSEKRYFASIRPIQVSPIGISNFFSEWGVRVLLSEAIYIGIPGLSLILGSYLKRKKRP